MRTRHSRKPSLLGALALAGLSILLPASAFADTARSSTAAKASTHVPLLWKVTGEDSTVHLLGSFHLLRPDDYPLSPDVDAAFNDAEKLVFELSPEEMASPSLAMQMGQAALRTDGTQLNSELPPETVAALQAWVEGNGEILARMQLNGQVLQMFEPWFAGLMVTMAELMKHGLDPTLGMDHHLAQRATQAGKSTRGLETGAEQIAFLDGMEKEEQLQFLQEALKSGEEGQQEVEKLHGAWRNGDADLLWNEMAVEMRAQFPRLYHRINVERNDAWLPKIEALLKGADAQDSLVVVGALHLLGEDGVVEKLRAKGYRVERICSNCATR